MIFAFVILMIPVALLLILVVAYPGVHGDGHFLEWVRGKR